MSIFQKWFDNFVSKDPKISDYYNNENVSMAFCDNRFECNICTHKDCEWVLKDICFDPAKRSILIIDDNPGMVSFLREDIEDIFNEFNMDIDAYNILEFSSKYAVYNFIATNNFFGCLNVDYAIIDITFGGNIITPDGNMRLNGLDIFKEIYKCNKEFKFVFYTGNALNTYIKSNRDIVNNFKDIYNDNISHYILYKTSFSMADRRKFFAEKLFNLKR